MRAKSMVLLVLALACTERRRAEAPFVTCPVGDVRTEEGGWVGTGTALVGPPGAFPRELAGEFIDVALVGFEAGSLELEHGRIRDDGGFYAVVFAAGIDIRELPVRVTAGTRQLLIHPPRGGMYVEVDHSPAIVESPDGQMFFGAALSEPLELGAFLSLSTEEMIALPENATRIDTHLEGHEGHRAVVGLRTEAGTACFRTPCGCAEELREQELCGPPPEEPDEPAEPDDDII
jgi:hypothetical protein